LSGCGRSWKKQNVLFFSFIIWHFETELFVLFFGHDMALRKPKVFFGGTKITDKKIYFFSLSQKSTSGLSLEL
jgi:hypothetical protein